MHSSFAAVRAALSFRHNQLISVVAGAALLVGNAATARAQSALDGFDPNANGSINAIVLQPDGKILIAGGFTTVAPNGGPAVTRNRVARLNPDGTLDTLFNPSADDIVADMVLQADGKVVIGGMFLNVNGVPRARVARLDPVTGAPDSFDPSANGTVSALALQADGKILVGGAFASISGSVSMGGQPRNNLARLDPKTGTADSFNPNPSGQVLALAVQRDGKILAGGQFFTVAGQNRFFIARLDPATGLPDSFNPNVGNGRVFAIAVQPDGKVLIAGNFSIVGGQTRLRIARLDSTTGAPDSFNPSASGSTFGESYVSNIVVQSDGRILVGGGFDSIGGQVRRNLARVDATSGLADGFDPNPNAAIGAIAVQLDGKVLIGGSFTWLAPNGGTPVTRNRIARLERDGRLDQTLNLSLSNAPTTDYVQAMAVQPDGKVLIAGRFSSVLGVPRNSIARLHTDGTVDATFNPNVSEGPGGQPASVYSIAFQRDGKILIGGNFNRVSGQQRPRIARLDPITGAPDTFNPAANDHVHAIAVQADGEILVAGQFTSIGGQTRNRIARISPKTGLADGFNPNSNTFVTAIAVQPDRKILVGGYFETIGGQPRLRIARLDPVTGLADSFDPQANSTVNSIVIQPDGKVLVGGSFTTIGGQMRNRLARLDPVSGAADSFNPNASENVYSLALQADGKVLVSGFFTSVGGAARNGIARLDPNTSLADAFNPGASQFHAVGTVFALAIQADGKILAAGQFTSIGGQSRNLFGRLSNDTPARPHLAVSHRTVAWTRAGASPQFTRVTFESSDDGVNYTALGEGTAENSDWILTGLSLPAGQNIYIRARGYYRTGESAAEGIEESVRNAFIPTLQLTASASRKTHGNAGTFDIPLPLAGEPGVECRSSGGAHNLVFTFSNNVVSGSASVAAGTGSVSGTPTFSGQTMTVNLTGVADVQKITVALSSVTDSFGQVLPDAAVSMNLLVGDINSSKAVNASDIGAVKAQSGIPVTAANFRADVAVSGGITASDIGVTKSRSGQTVP